MMKRIGFTEAVIISMTTAGLGLSGQVPLFELAQKELFSAGGAFVNAWADYDGDGDLDLFVGFDGAPNRLYRNQRGTFADVAAKAMVADGRPTRAAAWGDADGDGDVDLLVGFAPGAGSVLKLYLNTKGVFADHTDAAGLSVLTGAVRQPVWVDFDGDADLDLFVAFRDRPNAMYRNDAGTFVDVAQAIGLADPRRTVGAVWFDYDEDGDLDVVTGNMDGDANGLFSQGSGPFVDIADLAGVQWGGRAPEDKANGTVRPCVADVNNDGHFDLFFANYGPNGLFLNRGKGRFDDVSAAWGVAIDARYDSCAFGDMDNDGDLDLYVNGTVTGGQSYRDYLLRNERGRFLDATPPEIGSPNGDHGVQWADADLDGDLDLALTGVQKEGMHWLLRNLLPAGRASRSLRVRVLDDRGRAVNAGAEIVLSRNGKIVAARLGDGGSGYNSQNDAPVHIGLSDMSAVTVTVTVKGSGVPRTVTENNVSPLKYRGRSLEIRLPSR